MAIYRDKILQGIKETIIQVETETGEKPQFMVLSPMQWLILEDAFKEDVEIVGFVKNSDQEAQKIREKVKTLLRAYGFTGHEPWICFEGVYCIQRGGFPEDEDFFHGILEPGKKCVMDILSSIDDSLKKIANPEFIVDTDVAWDVDYREETCEKCRYRSHHTCRKYGVTTVKNSVEEYLPACRDLDYVEVSE